MSYNPDIGNLGIGEILNALPNDITELGLVGCELDDDASPDIIMFIPGDHAAVRLGQLYICLKSKFNPVLISNPIRLYAYQKCKNT